MKLLTFADGEIRLGGEVLPGLLTTLSVGGRVRYDEQQVDGTSGKSRTPQGWEDQTVSASLTLLTDEDSDCYEKLERLAPFFRGIDDAANPKIYALVNRQAGARGIREVVFDRLESRENDRTDTITVTLGFTEHRPPIVRQEAAQAASPTPGEMAARAAEAAAGQEAAQPEESPDILSVDVS